MTCGIYQIKNTTNGNIYIGSSDSIKDRWSTHKARLKIGKHHSKHLQSAFDKYGKDAFEFSVLLVCSKDMLLFYEQKLLDEFKPAYNMKQNADRPQYIFSEEQKAKISATLMGHPVSDETRKKMSESKMGKDTWNKGMKGMLGKPHSEEAKQKMRGSRIVSEESHEKRSLAAKLWHALRRQVDNDGT